MVHLYDVVNRVELAQSISDGLVTARTHNELPLTILNYTPACQYGRHWSETNKACRGLIYNHETMEVVARPFPKFMNWDQSGAPYPPSGPALQMPKMDGSLGILYPNIIKGPKGPYDSALFAEFRIATRGSFHSEQAEWATKWFSENDLGFLPRLDKTYLFEIIYPENRIVVDYGEYEGLVLIDVIDNATGFADTDEFDNCEWDDKVIRKPVAGFDSGQAVDIPDGDEGFVYLWPTRNFRTKMKAAEYIRIHRLVSGLTEKSIWQHLNNGGTLDQLKKDLPEEFHDFIDKHGKELQLKASYIVTQTYAIVDMLERTFNQEITEIPRKDVALWVKANHPNYAKYIFLVVDNRSVYEVALASVKPQREVSLVKED